VSSSTRGTETGTAPTRARLGLRAAPWVLWFGVLGGAVAWSLHTVADWGIDETVCRSGHAEMVGVPLRPLLAGLALLFLAVTVWSGLVSFRHWRRLSAGPLPGEQEGDEVAALRRRRAGFMAQIGFVANVIFALMLVTSATAVLILPACAGGA
jgi:hypothetical protein